MRHQRVPRNESYQVDRSSNSIGHVIQQSILQFSENVQDIGREICMRRRHRTDGTVRQPNTTHHQTKQTSSKRHPTATGMASSSSIVPISAPPATISPEEHQRITQSTPASFSDIPSVLRSKTDDVCVEFDPPVEHLTTEELSKGTLYVTEG